MARRTTPPAPGSIAYVGDGSNDLCAGLMLGPCDVLFSRRGFALDKHLQKMGHLDGGGGSAAAAALPGQRQGEEEKEGAGAGGKGRRMVAAAVGASGEPPEGPLRAAVVRWEGGGEIEAWLGRAWWGQAADSA
jgi:hypothetical protein